jgi:RNA polymerase sigma-B factor
VEALEAGRAYAARSLTSSPDGAEVGDAELIDLLEEEDRGYEAVENRQLLASGLHALDERDREILRLRFAVGLTQSQIAAEIGISQMHVSRLIRRALETLSQEIEEP